MNQSAQPGKIFCDSARKLANGIIALYSRGRLQDLICEPVRAEFAITENNVICPLREILTVKRQFRNQRHQSDEVRIGPA
jgi:hypothetical protein